MKIESLAVLFFMFFVPLTATAQDADNYVEEAIKYHNNYDNINTVKSLEKAYALDSRSYNVVFNLTRACCDAGEEFYEKKNKDKAEVYINKGVAMAEKFQKLFPDSSMAYAYLAIAYGSYANYAGGKERIKLAKKVEENAKKAIKLDANNFLPYVILGIYYRELANLNWLERAVASAFFGSVPDGNYEDSEKMLKKALALKPDLIVAIYHLSRTYRKMDKENDEVRLLKKVISLPVQDFRDKFAKQKAKERLDDIQS